MTSINPYDAPKYCMSRVYHSFPSEPVKWLQYELQRNGSYIYRIDGIYGEKTERAVKRYQGKIGLERTGKVDAETAKALGV